MSIYKTALRVGTVFQYKELSEHYQLAIAHYMAVHGEAWDWPEDYEHKHPFMIKYLKAQLPHFVERYGHLKFGSVAIPKSALVKAVMQLPDISQEFTSFEAYQKWSLGCSHTSYWRRVKRTYDPLAMWPVILDSPRKGDNDVLQDGWHRFAWYCSQGATQIPAVYYLPKIKYDKAR